MTRQRVIEIEPIVHLRFRINCFHKTFNAPIKAITIMPWIHLNPTTNTYAPIHKCKPLRPTHIDDSSFNFMDCGIELSSIVL